MSIDRAAGSRTSTGADPTVRPTLVLGGTGKTGRRVVERLVARGVATRVGSRAGDPPFDWDDPATWPAALDGMRAVYLAFVPDLAVPGAPEKVGSLVAQAVARGVERLVLLSGRGEDEAQLSERHVQDSGADATVLRAAWFSQNFSESYFLDGIRDGVLALPAGTTSEPFLDADDIADLAVAALTEDGHAGRVYELTGPQLLTFHDAVADIAAATGRDLRFQPVPMADWLAELARQGLPADVTALLRYLFTEVLGGDNERVDDGVARGRGRPPRTFADYARRTAATGVWDAR